MILLTGLGNPGEKFKNNRHNIGFMIADQIAKHYFCNECGVYTHHVRRRDPEQISVNLMCVDDIFIPENTVINLIDGASHD